MYNTIIIVYDRGRGVLIYKNHEKLKRSYLLGHVRLLCPSLQVPQVRRRLAGEELCSLSSSGGTGRSGAGVVARPGFGTLGFGHVMSLSSSGQNGLICSNRYH